MKQAKKNLLTIVLVTSLSFLGMALPYPIMAPLFFSEPQYFPPESIFLAPALLYGLSLAAYPFAQFFGSIWLGRLSDKVGRKPSLQVSIVFTVFGFLLSAKTLYDHNLYLFIASRFITGFFEGQIAIARALASDLGNEIDKAKSFGWLNAAATSGYLIGPIIGGLLADSSIHPMFSPGLPFVIAAILCAISLAIVSLYIKEPRISSVDSKVESASNYAFLKNINIKYLVFASFFITLSFDIVYQFFPVFLVEKWKFNEFGVAMCATTLSLFMIISQTTIVNRLKKADIKNSILAFAIIFAVTLVISTVPKNSYSIFLTFPIVGLCIGIIGTLVPVYVSDQVSEKHQGTLMGILMGSRSLGDAGICIIGSIAVSYSYLLPFFLGAFVMLLGGFALLIESKPRQVKAS